MVEGCDVVISDFGNRLLVIIDFGDGVELVKLWYNFNFFLFFRFIFLISCY